MADKKELSFVDKVSSASKGAPEKLVEYRALVDLYYEGKQVSAGDVVTDIPEVSLGWLLDGNCIEKVS